MFYFWICVMPLKSQKLDKRKPTRFIFMLLEKLPKFELNFDLDLVKFKYSKGMGNQICIYIHPLDRKIG